MQQAENRPSLSVELSDGLTAILTPITPADRSLLQEGLRGMSVESRMMRFGSGHGELTAAELTYLTEIDQRTHVAWGALIGDDPAGVGRYIRLRDGCEAEIAITVVDRFKRKGLGRAIFHALVAVARADGLVAFRFQVLAENQPVLEMLQGVGMELAADDEMVEGRIAIEDVPVSPLDSELLAVMERCRSAIL